MRVALLLSGHLRSFDQHHVFKTFKDRILNDNDVDVFCSTWETPGWWTSKEEGAKISDDMSFIKADIFKELYNPVVLDIQNYHLSYRTYFENRAKRYEHKLLDPRVRIINPLSMYYKMQRVINIFEDYVDMMGIQYDVVIRTRPDIILENFQIVRDDEAVTIDGSKGIDFRGVGDMLQMGTQSNILKFNRLFEDFDDVIEHCHIFDPHVYIEKYMELKSIQYKAIQRFVIFNAKKGQWQE